MSTTTRSVLFLVPHPTGRNPSQRFRVEQLLPLLDEAGITYTVHPFLDEKTSKILYQPGRYFSKAWGILKGYGRRLKTVLVDARRYDAVFVHREAAPLGPPIFEWLLKKVTRKPFIYDFDDAIWIPATSAANRIIAPLKGHGKVAKICRWATVVSGGNEFLCDYARTNGAQQVVRVPTVVDTGRRYNQVKQHDATAPVTIGWTGSHSTLPYLDAVVPVLQELEKDQNCSFLLIADKAPELPLKRWRFVPWNAQTEIADLLQIDVGIMPLTPDRWSEGKCGFKLIQYGAVGLPAVASPVGVNTQVITEGKTGFLAGDEPAWSEALRTLVMNADVRRRLGAGARRKIVAEYSVTAVQSVFLSLFKLAAGQPLSDRA
jgi:glycosyltransferase involved in cell wall biosynthesis